MCSSSLYHACAAVHFWRELFDRHSLLVLFGYNFCFEIGNGNVRDFKLLPIYTRILSAVMWLAPICVSIAAAFITFYSSKLFFLLGMCNLDDASVSEYDILLALRQLEVRRIEELCIVSSGWSAWLRREGDGGGIAPLYFSFLTQHLPCPPLLGVKALFTRFQ